MNLTVIFISNKLKSYESEWIGEYTKRIQPYAKLDLIQFKENKNTWTDIEKRIAGKSYVFMLDERGKKFSTETLKLKLDQEMRKQSSFVFVIGGSFGIPNNILAKANATLSLSDFTLPHRLALLVLCEQLYRVLTLQKGHPYHHAE